MPPRRRVLLHIRHFGVGGIENALLGWIRGLDRRRFDVALSVALPTRELETIYRGRIPDDVAVHVLMEPDSWLARWHQRRRDNRLGRVGRIVFGALMAWRGQARIRHGLERLAPSHDVTIDYDLTLRKIAHHIDRPLIGVRHFGFWQRRTSKAARVGRAYRHYDCIAVLNDAMRAQAVALYGNESPRFATLPNAFDLEAMRHHAQRAPDTRLPETPYVVCVARLDIRTKGLDILLQAWRQWLNDLQPAGESADVATLVLVGDGADRAALEQMVRTLDLTDHVRFAGVQSNPYPWIRHARALVLASRNEGLPNVLLEAMALDCMVVATDCPVGPRDMLDGGKAGLLVPVEDPAALAAALRLAITDTPLRESCIAAAREQVKNYDIEAGNRRMSALIEMVVRQGGAEDK
jgi:glycosyltransferase involved in cell wall biosynthesis